MRFIEIISYISKLVVPAVVMLAALLILFRPKENLFEAFIDGAVNGMKTAVKLLPAMTALLCAVRLLSASGFTQALAKLLLPVTEKLGIPSEIMPLLVTRPISGSASTAMYNELLADIGPDSFAAMCGSVIMGSSDTMIYVISVYFSSVGVKNTRYAVPCAACVMIFCIFVSCFVCRLWFGA